MKALSKTGMSYGILSAALLMSTLVFAGGKPDHNPAQRIEALDRLAKLCLVDIIQDQDGTFESLPNCEAYKTAWQAYNYGRDNEAGKNRITQIEIADCQAKLAMASLVASMRGEVPDFENSADACNKILKRVRESGPGQF